MMYSRWHTIIAPEKVSRNQKNQYIWKEEYADDIKLTKQSLARCPGRWQLELEFQIHEYQCIQNNEQHNMVSKQEKDAIIVTWKYTWMEEIVMKIYSES